MICAQCKIEDKKSRVYDNGMTSTAMYIISYYDENGVYHHHDLNTHTASFTCSNGHSWSESRKSKCHCGWIQP